MATLNLVRTEDDHYFLQGTQDPSRNADFSLYACSGEGGDPFAFGNKKWEIVPLDGLSRIIYACSECNEVVEESCDLHPKATIDSVVNYGVFYDAQDPDAFWSAQAQIAEAAEKAGIDVPDYAKDR